MPTLTVAICTYNRSGRLPGLVSALRSQVCDSPFDILFVDNNSTDDTAAVLDRLAQESGAPLRHVLELEQGITHARNRAIEEALGYDYMIVMDDDELPMPGFIQAAVSALRDESAECAGGRVCVRFDPAPRPAWLEDNLLGFLAEVDYGAAAQWVEDNTMPIWTCNVAYRTALFKNGLRFDQRYNRKGKGIGGGEDVMMFQALLDRKTKMRYRPDMVVEHFVEPWRLKRSYFLKVHYVSGFKTGFHEFSRYPREVFGVPLFLFPQLLRHTFKTLKIYVSGQPGALRQAMNMTHAAGLIAGCFARWRGAEVL
ncbi:MAG: glycosyltransferase [Nitrosomonadales bacterium]|nr:MAG: glycosyltransferase [Nitrosomonadales bacterium]